MLADPKNNAKINSKIDAKADFKSDWDWHYKVETDAEMTYMSWTSQNMTLKTTVSLTLRWKWL